MKIDILTVFRYLKRFRIVSNLDTWAPHSLTRYNILDRLSSTISLLLRYGKEALLDRIVRNDGKWIVYNDVAKARPRPLKFCWVCRWIIHFELLPTCETLSAKMYWEQITTMFQDKPLILKNRKESIPPHAHDNASPHVAKKRPSKSLKNLNSKLCNTHCILFICVLQIFVSSSLYRTI